MTKKQNEMLQFLSKFKSCTEEQLIFFTEGTQQDINYLLTSNLLVKDEKTKLLYLRVKRKIDVRTSVALDVIKEIKNEIKEFGYKKLKDYSDADKIIIVIENDEYDRSIINTTKEVLICKYPIKIIDKIN